jgi:hypothetical protein
VISRPWWWWLGGLALAALWASAWVDRGILGVADQWIQAHIFRVPAESATAFVRSNTVIHLICGMLGAAWLSVGLGPRRAWWLAPLALSLIACGDESLQNLDRHRTARVADACAAVLGAWTAGAAIGWYRRCRRTRGS